MEETTSLSDLEGEEWDKWIVAMGRDVPEEDEGTDSDEPKPEPLAECKRLPLADMSLFGYCPEIDPFIAVVCEYCENLVKPQFFGEHIALRHSECVKIKVKVKNGRDEIKVFTNVNIKPRKPTSSSVIGKEETTVQLEKKNESNSKHNHSVQIEKNTPAALARSNIQISVPVASSSSSSKSAERRIYPLVPHGVLSKHSCSITPATSAVTSEKHGITTSYSSKHLEVVTLHAPTVMAALSVNTTAISTKGDLIVPVQSGIPRLLAESENDISAKKKRKAPAAKEKVYSPDIHCGVWNEQTKKNCMRALTCRTHSLLLKRAVPMRSKLFDVLLAEHRACNKAKKEKEEVTPLFIQTTAPIENPIVDSSLSSLLENASKDRFTSGLTFALTGSMASRLLYSWRVPDLVVPIALETSKTSCQTSLTHMEPALPGSFLPAEPPTRLPQLKPIFPKTSPSTSVLSNGYTSATISESLFSTVHPKPLSVCSLSLHNDGGHVGPHRRITMLRRAVRAAVDDNGFAPPIRTDMYGFPMIHGPNHSTIKAVLSNICGRAAQRSASQRNAKLNANKSGGSHSNKNSASKNVPKNATLVFKTFPVGSQAPLNKDSSQHSKITSVHAFTLVGTNLKSQPKTNLKRLAGESFKENDIVKSQRKSNPGDMFSKASQHGSHVVAVAYSNGAKVSSEGGGTSLLRTADRAEHGPGESLLVSNRSVGLLAARPHSSPGDSLPKMPTGITSNSVSALSATSADVPDPLRNTKAKGSSLIRLTEAKGKVSGQPVTCLTSGQTMMTFQQVLGPQVITQVQMSPKTNAGSPNLKFIPQVQPVSLANAKTFLLKKDHGET